jgi:uncharacterized membrane protein YbjE (DUF340 family)
MALPVDPFLYVALGLGFVGGRLLTVPRRWLDALLVATVLILIALLGVSLGSLPIAQLLGVIPVALAVTAVVLGVTVAVVWLLRSREATGSGPSATGPTRPWIGLVFLADVVAGILLGHVVKLPVGTDLRYSLYVLLALVGWGLVISTAQLRRLWVPLTAAILGAVAGGVFLGLVYTTFPIGFASTFGFGFYTLSGALVDARAGATLGFLAFLTNFLRENVTMLLSPTLGPRVHGEGLTAMGGATSMDTTLYFVTRFGDPEAATLALTSGLILTVMATLLLPLLLALPGG